MFESICFRRMRGLGDSSPLDIGILAEALLFYGRVHLVVEPDMLRQLIRHCGPETIIALIDEGFLTVSFLEQPAGIRKYDATSPVLEVYETVFNLDYDLTYEAEGAFRDATQNAARGRELAQRFTALAHPIGYDGSFVTRFGTDLDNLEYTRGAVTHLLRLLAPGYHVSQDLRFDVMRHASTFRVETNIDFAAADTFYKTPSDASHVRHLDMLLLLVYLLEARADLEFASHFRAEIASNPAGASLMQLRMNDLFVVTQHGREEIATFEKMVLPEEHRIREVINSGERTYKDVLALLRHPQTQKFRSWLKDQPPSAYLFREFYREVTAKTWVDKLPGKTFRWLIFDVIGTVISTLAGITVGNPLVGKAAETGVNLAVSGIDTFLLDSILQGWRPNQFVDGELVNFVAPSNS